MIERSLTIDILKVVAAQLIVWHHFSAYGPMAETMRLVWPQLLEWIYHDARMAVQVFLVVGGYLAAQSVMNQPMTHPVTHIVKRYVRLVPIYLLALALISVAVAVSRNAIQAPWVPSEPTVWQFLAHALLLQDLLGFEALSSGAWYVAIDFQLYALLVVLCHLFHGPSYRLVSVAVALLCVASMWHFNRSDDWDMWAIYFVGAYGLGVLAAWAKRSTFDKQVFWLTALLAVGALWVAYRTRLSLALITAVWLVIKPEPSLDWTPFKRLLHRLSNSAYVLFLTHFGLIVLFSAAWNMNQFDDPHLALSLTVVGWLCCVGLGLFMHEKAEAPMHHWLAQKFKPWVERFSHRNEALKR